MQNHLIHSRPLIGGKAIFLGKTKYIIKSYKYGSNYLEGGTKNLPEKGILSPPPNHDFLQQKNPHK